MQRKKSLQRVNVLRFIIYDKYHRQLLIEQRAAFIKSGLLRVSSVEKDKINAFRTSMRVSIINTKQKKCPDPGHFLLI
jgi:hypothetical protein